jgi:hypothetical protein
MSPGALKILRIHLYANNIIGCFVKKPVLVENSKRFPRRKSLAEAGKNLSPSLSTGSGHLTPIISLWLLGNIIPGGTLLWYKKQAFNRRRHRAPRLFFYIII